MAVVIGQVDGSLDPRRLRSARFLLRDARQPGERSGPGASVRLCRSTRSRSAPPPPTPSSIISGSPSRSIPTRRRSTGSCRSTSCRACSRQRNGGISKAGSSSASPRSTCCSTTSTTTSRCCGTASFRADLILGNHNYRPLMRGIDVPHKAYVNICGTDIVRDEQGTFLVLEDNARTPSGVSYVVENRHMMLRAFPDLLDDIGLRPIDNYGAKLIAALQELAPAGVSDPAGRAVVARHLQLGLFRACLPRPRDGRAAGRGAGPGGRGRARLDAHDRRAGAGRCDLSPHQRRLSRPRGLHPGQHARRARADAGLSRRQRWRLPMRSAPASPTTRRSMPICRGSSATISARNRFCTMSRPISAASRKPCATPSTIWPSWSSSRSAKPAATASRSGPRRAAPSSTIAGPSSSPIRPTTSASPASTCRSRRPWSTARIEPRHVDLRPFAVTGSSTWVLPGGLTRVALRRGSLVVNSSQGGGSKDTWVVG